MTATDMAICGLDLPKKALLCLTVDPKLKSLLIRGPNGVGKTTLVRTVSSEIFDRGPVEIPAGSTGDQIFGSLDVEATLTSGKSVLRQGILAKADGGFVCMDDADLCNRMLLRLILENAVSGSVNVESEGITAVYRTDYRIIATANIHGSRLPDTLLDLFDISVTIPNSDSVAFREDVIKSNLHGYELHEGEFRSKVVEARQRLQRIRITDDDIEKVVTYCQRYGVKGERGPLSTIRTSRALAALDDRDEISEDDIRTAALLCLGHRRIRKYERDTNSERVNFFGESHMGRFIHDDRKPEDVGRSSQETRVSENESCSKSCPESEDVEDVLTGTDELFESIDLIDDCKDLLEKDVIQKRKAMLDVSNEGRCISSRPMRDRGDISIDATVRHAAPYQKFRGREDRILLEKSDLMEKVREKRRTCMFMFMIDNSGSLVIRGRMRAVKASILSMLSSHYVRRDSVAIMTFNEESIGMILPPTRSVGGVSSLLDSLPTGRKTPLTEAIIYADSYISGYLRKHPSETCYVILMTDAKANISMEGGVDPFEEALRVARIISTHEAHWITVDTAADPGDRTQAAILTEALRSPYYKMDSLRMSNNN